MLAGFEMVPVFAGGGTRLPAYVGVLRALEELQVRFSRLVGSSGGSLVAALYCAGWSVERLYDLALDIDFARFRGFSLLSLMRYGGLSSGAALENWLDQQLGGARFCDLPLDLHVVATDVLSQQPVVFDRQTTPEMRVATAVRFSVGIPLLFSYCRYNDSLLVDGSILAEDALRQNWGQNGAPLILFRLRAEVPTVVGPSRSYYPLPHYLLLLIRTFLTSLSHEYVADLYWSKTLVIKTDSYSPLEFSLPLTAKKRLCQLGYDTTLAYLPLKLGRLRDVAVASGGAR